MDIKFITIDLTDDLRITLNISKQNSSSAVQRAWKIGIQMNKTSKKKKMIIFV